MRRLTARVGFRLVVAFWILAGSFALAGCTALTAGRPVPADADGPRPVRAAALPEALLRADTISEIMGASSMAVKGSRAQPFSDTTQFTDRNCMIAWTPAEQTVYAHSDWTALVAQTLTETHGTPAHFAVQAVVTFPSRRAAGDFFDLAVQKWTPCGNRTFETRRADDDTPVPWTFSRVSNSDSTLWMTQRQDGGFGWSCQRALRVSNNVAIDVLACKFYVSDEGITIAEGIDARLPSV